MIPWEDGFLLPNITRTIKDTFHGFIARVLDRITGNYKYKKRNRNHPSLFSIVYFKTFL
jgi:hypothetical protein